MDIVKILTLAHLKASFGKLKPKQKFFFIIFLLSLTLNVWPHQAYASFQIPSYEKLSGPMIFDMSDKSYQNWLDSLNRKIAIIQEEQKISAEVLKHQKLIFELKQYLESQKSPLANYASTLVTVKNWKQIIALSNAESSMCRNYPVSKANCWGVGGANLWDMGNNLGDGIIVMNRFLNQYPLRSSTKYAQMSFKQMNGLYKQPAAAHWLYNVQSTFDELSALESGI